MVLSDVWCKASTLGPVPVGTDGSGCLQKSSNFRRSRPCGDGWFRLYSDHKNRYLVPSLWGRMVPFCVQSTQAALSPVPVGTDGSLTGISVVCQARSRPCGDGWFYPAVALLPSDHVPSLWGRMVPMSSLLNKEPDCPVPVGTDGSH